MQEAIKISIMIVAVHLLFMEGMVLGWFRIAIANRFDKWFGHPASRYIQKPMWDCLACMASIWTCIISWSIDIGLMLLVCGINYLIECSIIQPDEKDIDG